MQVFICKLIYEWDKLRYHKALGRLDKQKKERIVRMVRKEDAYRSLLADVLLRTILQDKLQLSNEEMVFGTNDYGKPHLIKRADIFFNLTHSGEWVGCAIGKKPVGIDIERIRPINLNIAKRFFTPEEYFALQRHPPENRLNFFYDLWTLKESYIKAVGKGLAIPLNAFMVNAEGSSLQITGRDEGYRCKKYDFVEGYKMAVCSKEEYIPPKPIIVDTLRLIEGELITCV